MNLFISIRILAYYQPQSSICCLLLHIKHMSNGKRVPPVRMMNVGNCSHCHPLLLSHLRIIIKVNIFYNAADIMTDSTADSTHTYTHTHTHMSIHPSALILCSTKQHLAPNNSLPMTLRTYTYIFTLMCVVNLMLVFYLAFIIICLGVVTMTLFT